MHAMHSIPLLSSFSHPPIHPCVHAHPSYFMLMLMEPRRDAFIALLAAVGAALIVGAAVPLEPFDIDIDLERVLRDMDIFRSRASTADTEVDKAARTMMTRRAMKLKRAMMKVVVVVVVVVVIVVVKKKKTKGGVGC
jgi:hypothetical protein